MSGVPDDTIIKTGAVVLALVVCGGVIAYVPSNSQPAFAATVGDWSASGVSLASDDGNITDVYIATDNTTVNVTWSDFPDGEHPVVIRMYARLDQQGTNSGSDKFEQIGKSDPREEFSYADHNITSQNGSMDLTGSNLSMYLDGSSIIDDHSAIVADDFSAETNGGSKTTTVHLKLEISVASGSISQTVEYTDSFDVVVDNLDSTLDGGGSTDVQGSA